MSKTTCALLRVVMLLELLMGGVAAAAVAAALLISRLNTGVWAGPGTSSTALIDRGSQWLAQQFAMHGAGIAASAAVLALAALLLVAIGVRMARTTPRLVLSRGGMGEVAIDMRQVGLLAQHEAELVQGVREVNTTAESAKSGLAVQQTIAIEPEMAFAPLAEQVQQRVKQSLEFHLGFPVNRVQVLLRHTSMSKGPI